MQAIAVPWWSVIAAALIPTVAFIFRTGRVVSELEDTRKRVSNLEGEAKVVHNIDNRLTRVETKIDFLVNAQSGKAKNEKTVTDR